MVHLNNWRNVEMDRYLDNEDPALNAVAARMEKLKMLQSVRKETSDYSSQSLATTPSVSKDEFEYVIQPPQMDRNSTNRPKILKPSSDNNFVLPNFPLKNESRKALNVCETAARSKSLFEMGFQANFMEDWDKIVQPEKMDLYRLIRGMLLNHIKPNVQVRVGASSFNCHMLVLQCYSDFFLQMSSEVVVHLPEDKISPLAFVMIYSWMLADRPLIERDGLLELFRGAKFLGIPDLTNQCWMCFDDDQRFKEDAAFMLYMEARQFNMKHIMSLMLHRVCKFFLTFVSSAEFLELSCEEVCLLLNSNNIGINTEIEIFYSVVRWLNGDWENRKEHTLKLCECIRFSLLPPWFLVSLGKRVDSLHVANMVDNPEVMRMIQEGITYTTTQMYYSRHREIFLNFLERFQIMAPVERNWIYDENCAYHHNAECVKLAEIPYSSYLEYLAKLNKGDTKYWQNLKRISLEDGCPRKNCEFSRDEFRLLTNKPEKSFEHYKKSWKSEESIAVKDVARKKAGTPHKSRDYVASLSETTSGMSSFDMLSVERVSVPRFPSRSKSSDRALGATVKSCQKQRAEHKHQPLQQQMQQQLQQSLQNPQLQTNQLPVQTQTQQQQQQQPQKQQNQLKQHHDHDHEQKQLQPQEEEQEPKQEQEQRKQKINPKMDHSIEIETTRQVSSQLNCKCNTEKSDIKINQISIKPAHSQPKIRQKCKTPLNIFNNRLEYCSTSSESVQYNHRIITKSTPSIAPQKQLKQQPSLPTTRSVKPSLSDTDTHCIVCHNDSDLVQIYHNKNYDKRKKCDILSCKQMMRSLHSKQFLIFGGTDPYIKPNAELQRPRVMKNSESEETFVVEEIGDKVLMYDDKCNDWNIISKLPFGSRHHHVAFWCNDLIYIVGGARDALGHAKKSDFAIQFFEKTIWSFNLQKSSWVLETVIPEMRRDFSVIVLDRSYYAARKQPCVGPGIGFFVIGGESADGIALNTVLFYNVENKRWVKRSPLCVGRYGFSCTLINNEIWVAGGITQVKHDLHKKHANLVGTAIASKAGKIDELITDEMECYSLSCADEMIQENLCIKCQSIQDCRPWIKFVPDLRIPRLFGRFCKMSETELYLIGGICLVNGTLTSMSAIDKFDMNRRKWMRVSNLIHARHGHDVAILDERIAIVGGVSVLDNKTLCSVETYNTADGTNSSEIADLPWPISGGSIVSVK